MRETYGAAVGVFRAARATDPAVRDAMRAVSKDECGHAELSWRILAWTLSRLDEAEQRAIAYAMRAAQGALALDIAREAPLAGDDATLLGMPSIAEKLELHRAVEQHLC